MVQAVTGFLSAYFMEKPEFRVQQNFVELESGMHVWVCDIPPNMKVLTLLEDQSDIPPPLHTNRNGSAGNAPQYAIDARRQTAIRYRLRLSELRLEPSETESDLSNSFS